MASPDVSKLVDTLAAGAKDQQWLNKTLVPSITILVFDWLLTLDLEVALVWNSPRSGAKLLYLLTRYLPFIDIPVILYYQLFYSISQHSCKMSYRLFASMFLVGQSCAIVILTLRTCAICGKNTLSTYGLFAVCGMSIAAITVLTGLFLGTTTFKPSPFPQVFGCLVTPHGQGPVYLASMYVILMVYDGGLLLLMIVQAISTFTMAGRSKLMRVVFRDGIMYYIYIFALSLVNALMILRLSDVTKYMLVPIERVAYSIVACRVVLHIREQGQMDTKGTMVSEQISGPMRFAAVGQRTTTGPVMTGFGEDSAVDHSASSSGTSDGRC